MITIKVRSALGLVTVNRLSKNNKATGKSLEKLSSGMRINKASDDAAGLAISEKMRAQIRGLDQAVRNIQDGISLLQTAEGGLANVHAFLQRARELAVQGANDTLTELDRQKIQQEIGHIQQGINESANNTQFNGIKLLNVADLTDVVGSTTKIVSVNPGQRAVAGYVEVPNPPNPSTLTIKAYFGTLSGATWPDLNVQSPNGEWFGYNTSNLNLNAYQESTTNTSSTKATYTGWGSSDEEMTFENPISGKWYIEIRHDGGVLPSTFNLESNYLIYDATTTTSTEVPGELNFHIGANSGDTFPVDLADVRTIALGIDDLDLTTRQGAELAISKIDTAVQSVSSARAKFGACQNRLEHIHNNVSCYGINLTSAESRIRDADMAQEIMEFTKNSILAQVSQAMVTQANQQPQAVLELLI